MAELFEAVASWQTLLLVLLVFGFAPGFVLRLLVLAYPRSDPRRRELIAELYAVPRIQRPVWVAEQLEVALFEGFAHRVSAAIRSFTRQRRALARTDKREAWNVAAAGVVGGFMAVGGNVAGVVGVGVAVAVAVVVVVGVALLRGKRIARRRLSAQARRRVRP